MQARSVASIRGEMCHIDVLVVLNYFTGTWRNLLFAIDPSLPGNSFLPTKEVSPPCELCPNGTYKYTR